MSKFTLTAKDLEDIAPTLSAALLHPLNILFDDVADTLGGGDQEVYNAVRFGIGISKTLAGDWEISEYNHALIAWHIVTYTTEHGDAQGLHHISRVVEAILRLAASTVDALVERSGTADIQFTITASPWTMARHPRTEARQGRPARRVHPRAPRAALNQPKPRTPHGAELHSYHEHEYQIQ